MTESVVRALEALEELRTVYGMSEKERPYVVIKRVLERERTAMRLLEDLTPSGSEFVEDPQRCYDVINTQRGHEKDLMFQFKRQRDAFEEASKYWHEQYLELLKHV